MARYSLGVRTVSGVAGTAALEIFTGAVDISAYAPRRRIVEISITLAEAIASDFAVGRPAAIGITPTAPVTLLNENTGRPPSTVHTALAWGTGPTVPAAFYRRACFAGAIGDTLTFRFGEGEGLGLTLAASDSIVLWNMGTNALADVRVVVEE